MREAPSQEVTIQGPSAPPRPGTIHGTSRVPRLGGSASAGSAGAAVRGSRLLGKTFTKNRAPSTVVAVYVSLIQPRAVGSRPASARP
ncbi:MAG TPA: hypothetical protein VFC93_16920 [Chloroflexota bacterium]|nr:hypothetical protein [Chloroflexota bacterium]